MSVDLHLHSTYSDGTSTPAEIVSAAVAAGLSAIALTDHDTLAGIPAARGAARAVGLRLISGTELSVEWREQSMHLLVYYLEPGTGPLQDELGRLQRGRAERNAKIATKLSALGLEVSLEEVRSEAGIGVIGRPHFAGVLMAKGYVATITEAFDRYLADGRPAYAPRQRLTAQEAIELSRASGAVPVIAHPHTLHLRAAEFAEGFADLVRLGLGGIESYYGEYTPELRMRLAEICRSLGVVATGGSDYHGRYKPHLSIGTGTGDLRVPDTALEELDAARLG